MEFTAKDVANLRSMTGAGMMDCKRALTEADGDVDKAIEILREKGLAAAAKKAGRIAADGYAYAGSFDGIGVVVEVNCETDFVSKTDEFKNFVTDVAAIIAKTNPTSVEDLETKNYNDEGMTVKEAIQEKVLVIGENIKIRRFKRFADGLSFAYIHMGGKIGVIVNMKVSDNIAADDIKELGQDVAMQVAAMNPKWLKPETVDPEELAKEKEILLQQTINEGKPQNIAEKIVLGRVNKFYQEVCLLNQAFVKENKISVKDHIDQVAKSLNGTIEVVDFVRYEKGEGIEKKSDNLADEVAKMIK